MNTFYKDYLSSEDWLLREKGFDPSKINAFETIFTLGNGYMGSRAILEEMPYDASCGTYIAGVFDKSISQVPELVNLPNPIDLRMTAEGEKVDIKGMYIYQHNRILDMRTGCLYRHSVLANSKKERFDYQSMRFISKHNKHIGVMRIKLTVLDAPCVLTVQDNINYAVRNKGVLTEGRKKHFQIDEVRSEKGVNYICAKTQQSKISIACATQLFVEHDNQEYVAPDQSFDIRLSKGKSLTLTKVFCLRTSRHLSKRRLRDTSIKMLKKHTRTKFETMFSRHISCFSNQWMISDIIINGDKDAQRSLRFNTYHLLITGNPYDDDVSIGAKTLSGEGYRGHVFWDTEIFILPFFIYLFPDIAKNLLVYRYRRLDAARKRAKDRGYDGVLFPWESADTGEDATPQWHKDLDGSIIPICTQDYEHHIVADLAYGVFHYYQATGDQKFINSFGAEMLFETARFWTSRVKENKRSKRFEIRNVMGPDEFHADVNNNAFTNAMAAWNLKVAADLYLKLKEKQKKAFFTLSKKIALKDSEAGNWKNIADRIYVPISESKKMIESFQGYFKKKDVPILQFDSHFMPKFPPTLPLKKVGDTQLIKQVDAAMLAYLLPDAFDDEVIKNTVNYYDKRTVHKSSLSPSISAIMNQRCGNINRAYQYYLYSLNMDMKMYMSNIVDGMHAASLGGVWQATVNGFGGMAIKNNQLCFDPLLPGFWQSLCFKVMWKGKVLEVYVDHKVVKIAIKYSPNKRSLMVKVFGSEYKVVPSNKTVTVRRKES